MNETLTDVSSLVNEAFNQCALTGGCGGEQAAYLICHSCVEGIICRQHFNVWMNTFATISGSVLCTGCGARFPSARDMAKVLPL